MVLAGLKRPSIRFARLSAILPDSLLLSGRIDFEGWFAYGIVTLVIFEATLSTPEESTLVA
jgi:hypothetical protein